MITVIPDLTLAGKQSLYYDVLRTLPLPPNSLELSGQIQFSLAGVPEIPKKSAPWSDREAYLAACVQAGVLPSPTPGLAFIEPDQLSTFTGDIENPLNYEISPGFFPDLESVLLAATTPHLRINILGTKGLERFRTTRLLSQPDASGRSLQSRYNIHRAQFDLVNTTGVRDANPHFKPEKGVELRFGDCAHHSNQQLQVYTGGEADQAYIAAILYWFQDLKNPAPF